MKTEEQLRPVVFQAIREGYRLIGVYFANNKGEKAEKAESFEILKGWPFHISLASNFDLDSATVYRNEEALGHILKEIFQDPAFDVKREDVFITSKLCE